jgi:hypothetical protein
MGESAAAGLVSDIADAHCGETGRCKSQDERRRAREIASEVQYAHLFSDA